jgi:hypothetical protein
MQRGVMLAFSKKFFTLTGYYFNPFTPDDFGVLTVAVSF